MKFLYTYVRIGLLGFIMMFSGSVFALDASNVQVLNPAIFASDKAELYANVNIGSNNTVQVWFEYGTNDTSLNKKTAEQTWERGYNFMSAVIENLSAETTYYYRAVLLFDGEVFRTDIKSLKTLADFTLDDSGTYFEDGEFLGEDGSYLGEANIINPFDYFKRNKNKGTERDDETSSSSEDGVESKKVEYQDEPVGGILNKDSVYYNNDDGDIIEYNDEYRNRFKPKRNRGKNIILFVIALLLAVIIFLVYKMRRKRNMNPQSRNARIQRLNQYRHPQHYNSASSLRPVENQPDVVPPLEVQVIAPAYQASVETKTQTAPMSVRPTPTEGTFFKAPPRK